MDLLEMPLEAVALRFYSLPAVVAGGSIWTCLAIIAAAAVGLWRIRTVGSRSQSSSSSSSSSLLTSSPPPSPSPSPSPSPFPSLSKPIERPILSRFELDEEVGTPKVRFTAYYNDAADCLGCCRVDDDDDDDDDDDEREVEADDAVSDGVDGDSQTRLAKPSWAGEYVPKWEVLALAGNGDLGWYRYQDMTALNGSVVRLWDGDGGLTASPRRRGIMGIYH